MTSNIIDSFAHLGDLSPLKNVTFANGEPITNNSDLIYEIIGSIREAGYDVTMKLKQDGKERPFRSQNQQIKVWLRRKVPVDVEAAITNILYRLEKGSPRRDSRSCLE